MRKEAFKEQEKLSLIGMLVELPYLIAVVVMAIASGSLILMLDAFDTAGVVSQAGISYGLSKKLQGSDAFEYDYGMGKIEVFGGLVSTALLCLGLIIVLGFSIFELFSPSEGSEGALLGAIALKIITLSIAIWMYLKQLRAAKTIESSLVSANLINAQKAVAFDTVAVLTLAATYFFRSVPFIDYLEPVICIICVICIGYMCVKNLRQIIPDLLDKTLDEDVQLKILKCISQIHNDIAGFKSIRTRRSGHLTYIDLLVSFDDDKTYADIRGVMDKFDKAIEEVIPDCITAIVINRD